MNKFLSRLAALASFLGWAIPTLANIPGGGTGAGANVTLTDNGSTVTIGNGIVAIVCTKSAGQITTLNYTFNNNGSSQTLNLLSGNPNGGKLYWENSNNQGLTFTYALVVDPASNGGNYAEISVLTTSETNSVLEVHYSLLRGSTGFYVTAIWYHRSIDGVFGLGECRDNIYAGSIFNWMSVDATRNRLMPVSGGSAIGVQGAPAEVSLWTNGIYAGQYEDKYKYSADFGDQRVWGWSSVGAGGKNVGLWNVSASVEYYNGGPLKRELMSHMGTTILNMVNGGHYGGGSDGNFAAGEVWTKVCGPFFIYCNNVTNTITGTNAPAQALFNDAQAQAAAEATAWPYSWFNNTNYAPASNRGTVSGQLVINDTFNTNAAASNLWVGLVQQPVTITNVYDFQDWAKPYQFWTKTGTNGSFTIPNVIAGTNYTLYAFGPGVAGTFQSQAQTNGSAPNTLDIPASPFGVTVTAGTTTNLGAKIWTPTRVGPTVFEIGYPDRTARKFRHGEDWWVGDIGPSKTVPSPIWGKHLEYPFDFPNGVNYTVGQSRWTTDWNYVQPAVVNSAGAYGGSTSKITFNLASAPSGTASLYLALASDYQGPLRIQVNGTDIAIGSTGYFPAYSSSSDQSDATIREGIHGMYSDNRITFSAGLLNTNQNIITINMRKGDDSSGVGSGWMNHAMYDYVRLELTSYVPPPPASAVAYAGNNCNLVGWPVTPGASSYNILRSTNSASGYISVANGVTGPVCGSGALNATWLDTTAGNGTNYYYVVRSVNPIGNSANSPTSSGATPAAGNSISAPAAPAGLAVSSVAHQSVTVNWSAVSGANYYSVYRSTLASSGGGSSNVLTTILLNNALTNTSYTDASPTDGSIYSYAVTATGAGGTSTNSAPAVGVPLPAAPSSVPPSLTASFVYGSTTNITLNWKAVSGAVGYFISRATSSSGPFFYLQTVTETTYTDYGLNPAIIYYYRVAAMNAAAVTGNNTDLVNSQQGYPPSLTATATNGQITLNWAAASGATSYTLKRGISAGTEIATVVTSYTGTAYTNTGLANGTTYYYVVTATGAGGTSGNSPEASATPLVAGDGIWISTTNGNWGDTTNWINGSIAAGAGNSADFSTLSLPTNLTVTLDSARTLSSLIFGDATDTYNWMLSGTNTLTLGASPSINVENQTAIISTPMAGSAGLTKTGSGILTLGGATDSYTGGTTLNEGIFNLDFSVIGSPTNALISPQALTFNGGSLTLTGSNSAANSQGFGATTLNNGHANVTLTPAAGGTTAATLATLTRPSNNTINGGTARFSTTGTATVSGTTSSTLLADNQGNPYATYGLNDWAGTDANGNVVAASLEETINSSVTWGSTHTSAGPLKFDNSSGAIQLTLRSAATYTIQGGYLMTPNSKGVTIQGGASGGGTSWIRPYKNAGSAGADVTVMQNSTQGDLIFGSLFNIPNGGTSGALFNLVKAGAGRLVLGQDEGYSRVFLNEGILQTIRDGQLGSGANSVEFYGGTLEAAATATFSTHPFNFNTASGLSVTAGNTALFGNILGGSGSVTIGGVSGDNGVVVLTNANYYTGGTALKNGTLNINGIYALGGATYGGLTLNGGTLQYAANFTGNNGSADLTSIGTSGITLASGGGTVDVNGNSITYANSIGNGGGGALTVKSSLPNGIITFLGANAYSGNTAVTNVTLMVNNPSGSATGSGNVTVQNGGMLAGSGDVGGSVTVTAGGTLAPGNPLDTLNIGNDLVLAAGSKTLMQVQHSPFTNNAAILAGALTEGGTLVVTNIGITALAAGDTFQLFSAAVYSGTFSGYQLPALATNLVWNTNLLNLNGTLSVAAYAPPVIGQLAVTGTNLTINGSGGIPGWNYYVLTTTNLTVPSWTPVATNQFDADGNFYFTNPVSAGSWQRFFRLQLP